MLWGALLHSYIHKDVVQSWRTQEKKKLFNHLHMPLSHSALFTDHKNTEKTFTASSKRPRRKLQQITHAQAICSSVNIQKWEMNLEGMTFIIINEAGVKRSHDGYLFTTLLCFSLNNFMCRIAMTWVACNTLGDNGAKKLKWDDKIMGKMIHTLHWKLKVNLSALHCGIQNAVLNTAHFGKSIQSRKFTFCFTTKMVKVVLFRA